MASLKESYAAPSGQTIELHQAPSGKWIVMCWNKDGILHWEMDGKVISEENFRQTREPYTEETARQEFERWRK